MEIQEAIVHARKVAEEKYAEAMLCHANPNDDELNGCIECAREHEQLADWLEELKRYHEIGTLDDFQRLNYLKNRYEDENYDFCGEYGTEECGAKAQIEFLKEYEKIGTIKEFRETKERYSAAKPKFIRVADNDKYQYLCPRCGTEMYYYLDEIRKCMNNKFCPKCGQAIDWDVTK